MRAGYLHSIACSIPDLVTLITAAGASRGGKRPALESFCAMLAPAS
jgi:hypothetical protein